MKPHTRTHALPLQITYADTDAAGVVYYANYLTYMERARSAYLRALGFTLHHLATHEKIIFAVTQAHLTYHAPARLDDAITIQTHLTQLKRVSLQFTQRAYLTNPSDPTANEPNPNPGPKLLVDGKITLAILHAQTFTPRRLPPHLLTALQT